MAIDFPASPTTGQAFSSGGQTWTFNGSGWASSYQASGAVRQSFTATAGQTSFTVVGGYYPSLVDVYQNGVKLINGTDVTVTSGTTVVLAAGAVAGDIIEVIGIASYAVNAGPLSGMRNRLINGSMAVDQRNSGAVQTFTAGAALAYSVDRWYGYSTGANVTGQRVTGATVNQYRYQFTGAASVTAIGFGQRIEAVNSADLAGQNATLSVDLANSLLTAVTWTAYYANSTDTFGTLASPTRTQIATGVFTVSSTVSRYNASFAVPSAANTGIEIVFTVGAQTSGTWTIGDVQLELGTVATAIERRLTGQELLLCQRYYEAGYVQNYIGVSGVGQVTMTVAFKVSKRGTPAVTTPGTTPATHTPSSPSTSEFVVGVTVAGAYISTTWTASAEL